MPSAPPQDFHIYSLDPRISAAVRHFSEVLTRKHSLVEGKQKRPTDLEFFETAHTEYITEVDDALRSELEKRNQRYKEEQTAIAEGHEKSLQAIEEKENARRPLGKVLRDVIANNTKDLQALSDKCTLQEQTQAALEAAYQRQDADRLRMISAAEQKAASATSASPEMQNRVQDVITRWERDNMAQVPDVEVFALATESFALGNNTVLTQPEKQVLYGDLCAALDNIYPHRQWSEATRLPHLVHQHGLEPIKSAPGYTPVSPIL